MIENCGIIPTMDVGGNNNGSNGMGWGGDWSAWIIIFLIFALGGFGNNRGGFGGFGGGNSGVGENYVLATDFATIERKLDSVNAGICDSTFALNNTINTGFFGVQNALCQGFSGINSAITTQGYETRGAITDVGYAIKDCCCTTQRAIDGVNYNLATQANMLSRGIENGFSTTNYNMATQNCQTLSAIDKVGDRIIDYLANEKAQTLRDENFALKLAASQAQQNNYLISQLGEKCPQPAYVVQPPQNVTFPTNCCGTVTYASNVCGGCGCGNF